MGRSDTVGKTGMSKSNGSTGSQTGSGYSTDVSDDNLPNDAVSPASDANENSDSDDQVRNAESSTVNLNPNTFLIPLIKFCDSCTI